MTSKEEMKKKFLERVERYKDTEKDNGRLPAGSAMCWWCSHCGAVSERRPETYDPRFYGPPKLVCDECQEMIDEGVSFTV